MIIRTVLPPLIPPGSTVTTVNLTYSDSQWGDLLTSYDGHAITCDEIGNPLSYYNGSAYTFTWEGRRLVGAVKGSTNMSFTYDVASQKQLSIVFDAVKPPKARSWRSECIERQSTTMRRWRKRYQDE